ncbi:MAG: hypothetical protein GAK45_01987 [Pseudomonas citronellolis]|nr:MAG: hypothetical protein GAK45_01987 [Pseudomonas citronellolis]
MRREQQSPSPSQHLSQMLVGQVAKHSHFATGQGAIERRAKLSTAPTRHPGDQQRVATAQGRRQPRECLQCHTKVLARLQRAHADQVATGLQVKFGQRRIQVLGSTRMKALGMPKRSHYHALGGQAVMPAHFVGDIRRIGEHKARLCHTGINTSMYLRQALTRLGLWITQVGQVMQGHHHRPIESQWPKARLVVQVRTLAFGAAIETPLLQPPPRLVGARHLTRQGTPARVARQCGSRQLLTPAPAVEAGQFQVGLLLPQRLRQRCHVLADAGARSLQNAGVKCNPHGPPPVPSEHSCARANAARRAPFPSATDWHHASRSSATR